MDSISAKILQELLPVEKELPTPQKRDTNSDDANAADHWSHAVLLERAAYLGKLAKLGNGSADETLKEYAGHCAMLSFRARSGEAELHANFADLFVVLDGRATLVTGGSIAKAHTVSSGETRGESISGGVRQELRRGDVAHVPAGLSHQMLLVDSNTITCLVMKIPDHPLP